MILDLFLTMTLLTIVPFCSNQFWVQVTKLQEVVFLFKGITATLVFSRPYISIWRPTLAHLPSPYLPRWVPWVDTVQKFGRFIGTIELKRMLHFSCLLRLFLSLQYSAIFLSEDFKGEPSSFRKILRLEIFFIFISRTAPSSFRKTLRASHFPFGKY